MKPPKPVKAWALKTTFAWGVRHPSRMAIIVAFKMTKAQMLKAFKKELSEGSTLERVSISAPITKRKGKRK